MARAATEPEMVAAMQTLKQYDADVNTYVKCLEFEAKQNRLSREEQARRHNQAMDCSDGDGCEVQRTGEGCSSRRADAASRRAFV